MKLVHQGFPHQYLLLLVKVDKEGWGVMIAQG
jgi:hypothetical protein